MNTEELTQPSEEALSDIGTQRVWRDRVKDALDRVRALRQDAEKLEVALSEILGQPHDPTMVLDRPTAAVMQAVARQFDVQPSELRNGCTPRRVTRPRHMAMYVCRKHLGMTFTEIGDAFLTDHSTVVSACHTVLRRLKADDQDYKTRYLRALDELRDRASQ